MDGEQDRRGRRWKRKRERERERIKERSERRRRRHERGRKKGRKDGEEEVSPGWPTALHPRVCVLYVRVEDARGTRTTRTKKLERKRGEITSLPRGEKRRDGEKGEKLGTNGDGADVEREKNRWKNRRWLEREKRGGMGILENKVRATASVHRRRPWNGELCRFVQPAASWCAPTRYFGLSFAAERPPSANFGSKQNYKLCPTPLAPRTLPTSTDTRRSCCLAPRNVLGATRAPRYTAGLPSRRDVGHRVRYSTNRETLNTQLSFSLRVNRFNRVFFFSFFFWTNEQSDWNREKRDSTNLFEWFDRSGQMQQGTGFYKFTPTRRTSCLCRMLFFASLYFSVTFVALCSLRRV